MTFLSLNQKEFQQVLSFCNQISLKKSEVEVFTFTKMEIKDGKLDIYCLNSAVFYKKTLKINNLESPQSEFSFLVKTDILASTVSLISDDQVGLEINFDKQTLLIQGSKTKHTLRIDTQYLKDFFIPVENPENLQAEVTVNSKDLLEANKVALVSVGQPKSVYQPEFLSVCYQVRPKDKVFLVVSTDRFRITRTTVVAAYGNVQEEIQEEFTNFLIQPKNIQYLNSLLPALESVQLNFEKDFLWVKGENSILISRYSDGKYPDFDKIIPQSFACSFNIKTTELLNCLKQVYLFARNNTINKSITLKVIPPESKLLFTAETQDGYASESSVDIASYEGTQDEWTQAFNADYLIEYISIAETENILWEANPGKPSILSPENQKDKQLYLVSGLR